MRQVHAWRQLAIGILAGLCSLAGHTAEPAQSPLLTRATSVAPNLMLILDDSNSMDNDFVYPNQAPGLWQLTREQLDADQRPKNAKGELMDTLAYCAWNVNRLYYNPNKRYLPPKKADGSFLPNIDFSSIDPDDYPCKNANGRPRILTYKPTSTDTNYQMSGHFTFTDIGANGYFPKTAQRTDCKADPCTLTEERQNYANWFRYYRLRLTMAKTALSHAIADAPESLRFGWTRMSKSAGTDPYIESGVYPLGPLGSAARIRFHAWLDSIVPKTTVFGTPSKKSLHSVGEYFRRADSDGPWGTTPVDGRTSIAAPATVVSTEAPNLHASCRRSYAMMLTDGRYTDGSAKPVGKVTPEVPFPNYDGVAWLPDVKAPNGTVFKHELRSPYRDEFNNTMADIAMYYWGSDLRSGQNQLANNVAPIKGAPEDPAFWQHMNFMAITMGLSGSFAPNAANLKALSTGSKSWAKPEASEETAIDDLLHATINGRGRFINANDIDELTESLNSMVSTISRAAATQGGVAVSTVNLVAGTKKFVPVYISGQWTGNLIANSLDPQTGREINKLWEVEVTNPSTGEEGSNTIGPYTTRNIYTGTKPGAATKAVAFSYAAMNAADLLAGMSSGVTSATIDYLRGNRALEAGDNPVYRKRAFLLGDIVNSNPTFVGPAIDYGYGKLPAATQAGSYATYLNDKRSRSEGLVFIGANDGMLHAFKESNGHEVFAYVPHAVLPQIHLLAQPDYAHRYFVDGPTSQGDFYDAAASRWRTALVASAGAGAKSVFAIDASSNVLTAESVLWEVHSGMTPTFAELGNVLSEARIGQLADGTWVTLFGNGVHSKSGKAMLFIVNAKTGALVHAVDTGVAGNNGLGGAYPVLNARNQIVGVYAGDLKGNLWRFAPKTSDPTQWEARLLFSVSAGLQQAFTATPLAVAHPDGGMVVVAGTGRFFDAADLATTSLQTVYGIRDKTPFGTAPATSVTISGTSTLVMQTITARIGSSITVTAFDDTTSTQTVTFYDISVNPIDWNTKNGWYFNQPFSGQRMVYPVAGVMGKIAKVDTIVPNNATGDPCIAANPGAGYNYFIDAIAGGSPQGPFLDTNGDGAVNSSDAEASGYSTGLDGRDQVLRVGPNTDTGTGTGTSSTPDSGPSGCPDGTIKFVTVDSTGGSIMQCIKKPEASTKKFSVKRSQQQLQLR